PAQLRRIGDGRGGGPGDDGVALEDVDGDGLGGRVVVGTSSRLFPFTPLFRSRVQFRAGGGRVGKAARHVRGGVELGPAQQRRIGDVRGGGPGDDGVALEDVDGDGLGGRVVVGISGREVNLQRLCGARVQFRAGGGRVG